MDECEIREQKLHDERMASTQNHLARIAALKAALAKAEEALEEAYQPEGSHFVGDGCACVGCKYRRSRAALAAIKETRHDS